MTRMHFRPLCLASSLVLGASLEAALPSAPKLPYCPPQVVDASTLDRKFLFGYQGWFGTPGDGSANNNWFHWFRGGEKRLPSLDMLPDLSEYGADELVPGPLKFGDGSEQRFYSAYSAKTVDRHMRWMKEYGLDGVFLQRFSAEMASAPVLRDFRDKVALNVMKGAQKHGRVFAMMYDISGDPKSDENLMKDWAHLVKLGVTKSPRYLRHNGRPVLAVWGQGFNHTHNTPEQAKKLLDFFKNNPDPSLRVTLMGGLPTNWRSFGGDSQADPVWAAIYRSFDVISPWSINRYQDVRGADRFRRQRIEPDLVEARRAGRDYMPVLYPGYSAHNISDGRQPINEARRMGGAFFWRQVVNALDSGATMLYGAMFDEVDEGTAFYKVVADSSKLPQAKLLALDADGYSLPNDWYLRLAGLAGMALRGEFKAGYELPLDLSRPQRSEGCFTCPRDILRGAGNVISVDFVGAGPVPMSAYEAAGAAKAAFWNAAEFEEGRLEGLSDDSGKASPASLSWQGSSQWRTPIAEAPGDARMMKGYLDAIEGLSLTVKVAGLPARFAEKGYKVYAYVDGDDSEAERRSVFTLGSNSQEFVDAPAAYFSGKYAPFRPGKAGNYLVFDGLKGDSFELQATPGPAKGKFRRAALNGLQIIAK